MQLLVFVFAVVALLCSALTSAVSVNYWIERNQFIQHESSMALGSQIVLNKREKAVNRILMDAKRQEMKNGFLHPETFAPARHFFEAREDILKSPVYKFIQKMPKGGALHIHDTALCSTDFVLNNITYRDHLYGLISDDDNIKLVFADKPPSENWKLVSELRQSDLNFDQWLRSKITMLTENPYEKYPDINSVWDKFSSIFGTVTPMITYRPVFLEYYYEALTQFRQDNVNYVEVRGTLPPLYELNGDQYSPVEIIGMLKAVTDEFLENHPDFLGIKYIYAPPRSVSNATMDKYIADFKQMKKLYPDFLLGFDLVGQEDLGRPLADFINQLQEAAGPETKYFFHAGETNWNGMSTDTNLVDAVLLNTTRIGHGYAIVKHPTVLEEVKRRGIGIEINPISNQVLNLVKDLRNHPGNILFSQDYPVVISSDDPGFWAANGLSFDFYEAFMGLASATSDLRMLKQLAINSFTYSALNEIEKATASIRWHEKWNSFIDDILLAHTTRFASRRPYVVNMYNKI